MPPRNPCRKVRFLSGNRSFDQGGSTGRDAPKAEHRRGVGTIRPALHISRTAIVGSGQPHPIDIKLGLTRKIVILCGKPQAAGKRGRASKVVPRASDDRLFACSADWTER